MIAILPRRVLRPLALFGLAVAATSVVPHEAPPPLGQVEVAAIHEARLRKLHLVRPDLINYPISFDIVC